MNNTDFTKHVLTILGVFLYFALFIFIVFNGAEPTRPGPIGNVDKFTAFYNDGCTVKINESYYQLPENECDNVTANMTLYQNPNGDYHLKKTK